MDHCVEFSAVRLLRGPTDNSGCPHQLPKPVLDQPSGTDNPDMCNLCIKTIASVEARGLIYLTPGNNLHLSEIYQVAQAGHKLLNKLPIAAVPLRKIYRSRFVSANLLLTHNMTLHTLRPVALGSSGIIQAASSFV